LVAATGFARVSNAFAVGDLVSYAIRDGNNWEHGIGTVGASNTLARSYVQSTLVSGTYTLEAASAISLSGSAEVFVSEHSGPWASAGGSHLTGVDIYLFSHGCTTGNSADRSTGANEIQYASLHVARPFVVYGLQLNVRNVTGADLRVGLFGSTPTGRPGARLEDGAAGVASSTGSKEYTLGTSRLLMPGRYWTAMNISATTTLRGMNANNMIAAEMESPNASMSPVLTESYTYGAMPATANAIANYGALFPCMVYVRGRNL
jgi:hypothetical protein